MKRIIYFSLIISLLCSCCGPKAGERWSQERAEQWYADHGWVAGCNFTPSNAINQLEMWQEETFDPETIDRELGWAEDLGFNCMRVFLHHVAWEQDKEGFKDRIRKYLEISDSHDISSLMTAGMNHVLLESSRNRRGEYTTPAG